MILEDLKDQFYTLIKPLVDQVEESDQFQKLQERFLLLPPQMQKITLFAVSGFLVFLVFLIPLSFLNNSQEFIQEFESHQQLIRSLKQIQSSSGNSSHMMSAPDIETLKSNIENQVNGDHLVKKIQGPFFSSEASTTLIPPQLLQDALVVKFIKLNLKQVLDIGYKLQNLHSSSKLQNIKITNNSEDARYLDVHFEIFTLKVPQIEISFSDTKSRGHE